MAIVLQAQVKRKPQEVYLNTGEIVVVLTFTCPACTRRTTHTDLIRDGELVLVCNNCGFEARVVEVEEC